MSLSSDSACVNRENSILGLVRLWKQDVPVFFQLFPFCRVVERRQSPYSSSWIRT